jgi:hypothetical protein
MNNSNTQYAKIQYYNEDTNMISITPPSEWVETDKYSLRLEIPKRKFKVDFSNSTSESLFTMEDSYSSTFSLSSSLLNYFYMFSPINVSPSVDSSNSYGCFQLSHINIQVEIKSGDVKVNDVFTDYGSSEPRKLKVLSQNNTNGYICRYISGNMIKDLDVEFKLFNKHVILK